jgi:hypothetical protein
LGKGKIQPETGKPVKTGKNREKSVKSAETLKFDAFKREQPLPDQKGEYRERKIEDN